MRLSNDPKPSFDGSIEKRPNNSGTVESDRRASRSFNGSHMFRRSTSAARHTKIVLRRHDLRNPLGLCVLRENLNYANRKANEKRFG